MFFTSGNIFSDWVIASVGRTSNGWFNKSLVWQPDGTTKQLNVPPHYYEENIYWDNPK